MQTRRKTCVVLISHIGWEKFDNGTGVREPILVNFPVYNKEQILSILSLDCPDEISKRFYETFIALLYEAFTGSCRDINELRQLVQLLFSTYHEPVARGEIDEKNSVQLFAAFAPTLKQHLKRLYLRTTSSMEWLGELEGDTSKVYARCFVAVLSNCSAFQ